MGLIDDWQKNIPTIHLHEAYRFEHCCIAMQQESVCIETVVLYDVFHINRATGFV